MFLGRWASWLERGTRPVITAMTSIGSLFLCVMMVWITADVALRFVLNSPIIGTFEMVQYELVFFVFLAFGFTQFNHAHIRVLVIVERFGPRGRAVFGVLSGVVTVTILLIMTYGAVLQTQNMFEFQVTSSALLIPKWPFQAITIVGLLAYLVAQVVDIFRTTAIAIAGEAAVLGNSSTEAAEDLHGV